MPSFGFIFCVVSLMASIAPPLAAQPAIVHGRITDKAGQLISSVHLRLEHEGWFVARTDSSATGEYQLSVDSLAGVSLLALNATEFLPARTNVFLQPGTTQQVNLVLSDDLSISGKVVALDKSPRSSIVVQAVPVAETVSAKPDPAALETGRVQPGLMGEYYPLSGEPADFPDVAKLPEPSLVCDGEIWFGTANRLSRYDGHTFSTFPPADGWANPRVSRLAIDDTGVVWIALGLGVTD
jgi:hypothetical protein